MATFRSFLYFSLFSIFIQSQVFAASFDCSKPSNNIETEICRDSELSRLDEILSQIYRRLAPEKPELIVEQRKWLRTQRNTCQTLDCLKSVYTKRIEILENTGACPIKPESLAGHWKKDSGEGFEEMAFSISGSEYSFTSWLHGKPEMNGIWIIDGCTIKISDPYNQKLRFDFKIQSLQKNSLRMIDLDTGSNIRYKKYN